MLNCRIKFENIRMICIFLKNIRDVKVLTEIYRRSRTTVSENDVGVTTRTVSHNDSARPRGIAQRTRETRAMKTRDGAISRKERARAPGAAVANYSIRN